MFCQECGKEVSDNAVVCVHCGVGTSKETTNTITGDEWYYSTGWIIFWVLICWPVAVYGLFKRSQK